MWWFQKKYKMWHTHLQCAWGCPLAQHCAEKSMIQWIWIIESPSASGTFMSFPSLHKPIKYCGFLNSFILTESISKDHATSIWSLLIWYKSLHYLVQVVPNMKVWSHYITFRGFPIWYLISNIPWQASLCTAELRWTLFGLK